MISNIVSCINSINYISIHAVHGANITIPPIIVITAVIDKFILKYRRHITANNRRFCNKWTVCNTRTGYMNDVPSDQNTTHTMVHHHEIAVSESTCSTVARAGWYIGAKSNNIISVQNVFQ